MGLTEAGIMLLLTPIVLVLAIYEVWRGSK